MTACLLEEITSRPEHLIGQLLTVWEKSVRATHLFLKEEDIQAIAQYVPEALKAIPCLVIARNEQAQPVAFLGTDGNKLEMLFVRPENIRQGLGKQLLEYAIEQYAIDEVCVNEQNPKALAFYERMGFTTYKRTETDEQGRPFPILYMKRVK